MENNNHQLSSEYLNKVDGKEIPANILELLDLVAEAKPFIGAVAP